MNGDSPHPLSSFGDTMGLERVMDTAPLLKGLGKPEDGTDGIHGIQQGLWIFLMPGFIPGWEKTT